MTGMLLGMSLRSSARELAKAVGKRQFANSTQVRALSRLAGTTRTSFENCKSSFRFGSTWIVNGRQLHVSSNLWSGSKDVVVPPFADSVSDGDVKWEKNVGDRVSEDETVCEIETDKTAIPVPAPGNGVIEEQYVEDGATVKAGEKLFRIKLDG